MNLLLTSIFIVFVFVIGILPFRVLYIFSDLMYFVLLYMMRYRKSVVRKNLESCFPEKSKKEIDKLIRLSYKNLTDVIVEGFKAFTMSDRQIRERHKVLNPEILEDLVYNKRGVIAAPCHYGNWEWGSMSPSLYFKHKIIVFYKPLSNPYINRFVNKNRSRTGGILTSIYKTSETFKELTDQKVIYIMAADQSPSNAKRAIWVDFLGRETAFLHGPEIYAKKYNYPVIFTDIKRVKRGFYELTLSIISDHSSKTTKGEITSLYAEKLETAIINKPEDYLWSHKRWKHQK
ncbi:MAG: lysophospholipid acyltransferase family protein [Bacteroidetes bacterium]|nr:lysophospholipid acyltransferase family protein [Bacteroidota bacterium]